MSERKFERYALAFYKSNGRYYPCQIEFPDLTEELIKRYWVRTISGETIKKKEDELLTGFEPDFPDHSCVEWDCFTLKDEIEELEPNDHPSDDLYDISDQEIADYYLETLGVE